MRNLKKLLSVLVVVAMVATLMVPAFAAPSDVSEGIEDAKVKAAVEKLAAFGIVNGKEDGKYHPEENITRDAFVKMVVEATGLGSAAVQGPTQFSDVPADRWSSGYIRVAVGAGIVKGRPDGTFGPLDDVTYAEAVTMLVRTLGYKDEFLSGSWPGNYLAKAAELGITSGVKVNPNGIADRGAVAVMLSNTLDAKVIKQATYGDENNWAETDITLLEDKLDIEKVEEVTVIKTPKVDSTIDEDELVYADLSEEDPDEETVEVVADFINIDSWLGLNVNIYLNDDGDVIYIEESDSPSKVIYDVIDAEEDVEKDSITLVNVDKEYEFDDNEYYIYVDNKELTGNNKVSELSDIVKEDGKTVFGKFVLNKSGNIVVADLYQFDGDEARIVVDVDVDEQKIIYNVTDADDEKALKLDEDAYDTYVIMSASGEIMDLADVQKDDIIYVSYEDPDGEDVKIAASGDTVAYVIVVRNTVEGEATSYDEDEIEIGGKSYDWTSHAKATVSIDNDDTYVLVDADVDELDDLTDAEAEVVALLDLVGDVRHVRAEVESSSDDLYGIVTRVDTKYGDPIVKILNYEEDEVEYEFDDPDLGGYKSASQIAQGDVVRYTVNKDGEIDSIDFIARLSYTEGSTALDVEQDIIDDKGDSGEDGEDDSVEGTVVGDVTGDEFGDESIEIANKDYNVADDAKIFNAYDGVDGTFDPADASYVEWADLKGKNTGSKPKVVALTDTKTKEVLFMVFVDENFTGADDEVAGYVIDARIKNGDYVVDVALPGSDEIVRYNAGDTKVADETIIAFNVKSGGDIDIVSTTDGKGDYETVTGSVYEISGKFVTIADKSGNIIGTFKVASSAVFYEGDDEKSFSDLDEDVIYTDKSTGKSARKGGSLVRVAIKDNLIYVCKIYDDDDAGDVGKFVADYNTDLKGSRYPYANPSDELTNLTDFYNRQN